MIPDSDLMELVQLYKARWLSCVTQEEAERLREENARLKEELAAHTRVVTPAGEDVTHRVMGAIHRTARVVNDYGTPILDNLGEVARAAIDAIIPPAEQAQMDLNAEARARRAKVGDGTPTHGVMPASEDIIDSDILGLLRDNAGNTKHKMVLVTRALVTEAIAEIERLRKFEEYDKRLRESARRERERGDDSLGPST